MLIEIKGVQFANKGAALMLQAILDRLQQQLPAAEVALAPGPNAPFRQVVQAGAWQRLRMPGSPLDFDALSYRLPRRVRELGRRHGVVTESDVDAVLDASGFAYGAVWDDAALTATAREIERLESRGKPYIFLPQAFGPFDESGAARAFGRALRSASLICAREIESRDYIEELAGNLGKRLAIYPDFTIGVTGTPAAAARWGVDRQTALLIPNAEMVGDRNPDEAWSHGYVPLLATVARRLAALGFAPRVLNHEGAADAALCESLQAAIGPGDVISEADPRALKGVVGSAGLVVCSRYHGCMNALAQGVPCLGTSWSHKYAALFNDFGVGEDLLTQCDVNAATTATERLVAAREELAARLAFARPALESRTSDMWERVFGILANARSQ